MRIAVIGAGFWGVACALALRDRGAEVDVYDDGGTGASHAAAGLVQKAWYRPKTLTATRLPDWWTDEYAKAGWALLNERCGLVRVGEWFGTVANPEFRHRSDLYMIEAPFALLDLAGPTHVRAVHKVQSFNDRAVHVITGGIRTSYESVVIAAGVRTDEILAASGLPPVGVLGLRGRAFLTDHGPADGIPYTWLGAPYRHLTWRPWAGRAGRLGDTVERGPLRPSEARWNMHALDALTRMDPTATITGQVSGVRPVLPVIMAERVTRGVWVATGGHRVGLALAGGIARRITEEVFDGRP